MEQVFQSELSGVVRWHWLEFVWQYKLHPTQVNCKVSVSSCSLLVENIKYEKLVHREKIIFSRENIIAVIIGFLYRINLWTA